MAPDRNRSSHDLRQSSRLLIGVNGAHSGSSSTYVRLGTLGGAAGCPEGDDLSFSQAASGPATPSLLEATIERQGRNAGLLGGRLTPAPLLHELTVIVRAGVAHEQGVFQPGLAASDAWAVLEGIRAVSHTSAMRALGPGRLEVGWALTHAIDSSAFGFRDLAGKLVPLLALGPDASPDDVSQAWRRQACELQP